MTAATTFRILLLALTGLVVIAGCGGRASGPGGTKTEVRIPLQQAIDEAADVDVAEFPESKGKTLEQIAASAKAGPQLGIATASYETGDNRFAFGLLDSENAFVYGDTVLYLSQDAKEDEDIAGPIVATPNSLVVSPAYRSAGAAEGSEISAIYSATLPMGEVGQWDILALTKLPKGLYGSTARVEVVAQDPVPSVGEQAPKTSTDTLASAGGDIAKIDTRVPNDDMHDVDLADVIGKQPVALLFATPQLCQSRVCGPVTDVAQQLKGEFGDEVAFIHQEVYEDNDPAKGFRQSLADFRLPTEPWFFAIDKDGKVAARLEGSFGIEEVREAIRSSLQ